MLRAFVIRVVVFVLFRIDDVLNGVEDCMNIMRGRSDPQKKRGPK